MNKVCPVCEIRFHRNDYKEGDVSAPYLHRYSHIEYRFHTGCEWAIERHSDFIRKEVSV